MLETFNGGVENTSLPASDDAVCGKGALDPWLLNAWEAIASLSLSCEVHFAGRLPLRLVLPSPTVVSGAGHGCDFVVAVCWPYRQPCLGARKRVVT